MPRITSMWQQSPKINSRFHFYLKNETTAWVNSLRCQSRVGSVCLGIQGCASPRTPPKVRTHHGRPSEGVQVAGCAGEPQVGGSTSSSPSQGAASPSTCPTRLPSSPGISQWALCSGTHRLWHAGPKLRACLIMSPSLCTALPEGAGWFLPGRCLLLQSLGKGGLSTLSQADCRATFLPCPSSEDCPSPHPGNQRIKPSFGTAAFYQWPQRSLTFPLLGVKELSEILCR